MKDKETLESLDKLCRLMVKSQLFKRNDVTVLLKQLNCRRRKETKYHENRDNSNN